MWRTKTKIRNSGWIANNRYYTTVLEIIIIIIIIKTLLLHMEHGASAKHRFTSVS
jgi:hypothetical protein